MLSEDAEPVPASQGAATPEIPGEDWGEPRFLHPASVIFEIISKVRQFIVPALIGLFSAAQGGFWGMGLATLVFGGSVVATLIRYWTLRYGVQGSDFVVTEGLLFKRNRSIPIRRIQNVDLVQNVLHRVFGVAEVRVETASGTEPEAVLRVLTRGQIEELRNAIFGLKDFEPQIEPSGEQGFASEDVLLRSSASRSGEARLLYAIRTPTLALAGVMSNRGAVLIGVLVGIFFQADFWETWDLEYVRQFLPNIPPGFFYGAVVLAFVALFLLLRLLGMMWYVLRFYGYKLQRSGDDLRISCGLFTRVSATIPRKRIQFISVHRPLLLRLFRLASLRIETAGGAGNDNENAASTVSKRWFLPVVEETEVDRILDELRPGMHWGVVASDLEWHGVSPLTGKRLRRVALLASLLLAGVGLAITRPWGWLAGPVLFPAFLWLANKKSKAKRYGRTEWGVVYQSGVLTRKMSFAFFDRMQGLEVTQTPFDRRWKMATLSVDTAAAGPAEHSVEIGFLDESFAFEQFRQLQLQAASHRPSWA